MSNISLLLNSISLTNITTDFLENNSYWKNSYYLAKYPNTRLIPCWTLDLNETTVSKPKQSLVMNVMIKVIIQRALL